MSIMESTGRVLLIEDDAVQAKVLAKSLGRYNYVVDTQWDGADGLRAALSEDYDAVVTDLNLPGVNGLELLRKIHDNKPMLPVIVITGGGTTDTAIEATKLGAFDYLMKPVKPDELLEILGKGVNSYRLSTETVGIGQGAPSQRSIIGRSPVMQHLFKEIGRAAAQEVPVLVQGETGTGKEMVARAIYKHSLRSGKPFVALNCAAIPEQLLESELFGHEKGAFTGATHRRIGRFEQASGGTIFLDEIGDLSFSTQAKLLRVLQEQEIQRLGGSEVIKVDARIIAATHRNLEQAISRSEFREDLYFRLNVMRIRVPSVSERLGDLPDLVAYFLRYYGEKLGMPKVTINPEALEMMRTYTWPGNVRELENVVRKSMLVSQGYQVTPEILRPIIKEAGTSTQHSDPANVASSLEALAIQAVEDAIDSGKGGASEAFLGECERLLYKSALEHTNGNKSKAAEILGVSRVTMREKVRRYKLA